MNKLAKQTRKWITFTLRWGVAVVGVWLVVKNISFHDRVMLVNAAAPDPVRHVRIVNDQPEDAPVFRVADPGSPVTQVPRQDVWTPGPTKVNVLDAAGAQHSAAVLAVHPDAADARHRPDRLLVKDKESGAVSIIPAARVAGDFHDFTPYPLIEIGLLRMVREADLGYLLAALLVMPLSYLLTSYRWHLLLEALDIHIGAARTFVINMVGAFYNTFMPGSTGGDLLKAWYAARHTTHRTRAVISVLTDRAIGLLALIMLGGVMAALQWQIPACRKVAMVSAALTAATLLGMVVFYVPVLRRASGLNFILRRLPMQKQVQNAVGAMERYGQRPLVSLTAMGICFPVHITAIVSATLAGHALGLHMPAMYYWVVVPVVALVGAIPISPQGAGVMEYFAILLTRGQGVTISQAFALVMAIRFVQMFWNLVAGLFVIRGGYHAPSEQEQHDLDEDTDDGTARRQRVPFTATVVDPSPARGTIRRAMTDAI